MNMIRCYSVGALAFVTALLAISSSGCIPSGPASVLRVNKYHYKNMYFVGMSGSEGRHDYIYAVSVRPAKQGPTPLLFRNGQWIEISAETKSGLEKRFPSRPYGGIPSIIVDEDIMLDYKENVITGAFAEKTGVAKSRDSEVLMLPCSLDALIQHFGKPDKVEKN